MYKIECAGPFKEGRASSILQHLPQLHSDSPDLCLQSSDGISLPSHRCLLALQSTFVADILATLPCCQTPSISVPFNATVLKNLLAVLSAGVSLSLDREDLLDVQYAADLLQIKLTNLKVEPSNKVVTLKVDGDSTIQDLYHQVTGIPRESRPQTLKPRNIKELQEAPKQIGESHVDLNNSYNAADIVEVEDSEVLEVTPEMPDFEGFAPHFLMEAQYGEDSNNSFTENNWMDNSTASMENVKMPDLLEFGEGEEKRFKCSFCPNKEFKKRPEVVRHFKKHIPLSQRKKFQCEGCKERFISNSNLKTHLKVCTGQVKVWTCKRCKAEYDNKTDYEDHLAEAHNTGRKHECSICHKQLRRAGDVRKHMLTHSEGKPFGCDICGKKFRTESYVKIHRQAHYTNSPTKDGMSPMKRIPHIEALGDQVMIHGEEAEVPAPQEEEIVLNGEPVSASEDTEGTEDEATMTPDEAMTPESEAVPTPESNEAEMTPDRECFLDPEDREMLGGYQQQILV